MAQILDSRLDYQRKDPLFYLIQWAGYEGTPDKYSWLPANELENAANLVSDYYSHFLEKPSPLI